MLTYLLSTPFVNSGVVDYSLVYDALDGMGSLVGNRLVFEGKCCMFFSICGRA